MNVLVATVEHSGTFTLLKLLGWREDGRGRHTVPLSEISKARGDSIVFDHLYTPVMPQVLDAAKRMPVMTTYRDVAAIRATAARLGQSREYIDAQIRNHAALLAFEQRPYIVELGAKW